ncbi:MAG TPA: DinB family protein [Tepidisphaeraceae bacterium]
MPQSDPLTILLAHDCWATSQLLGVSRGLSPDQFHQRFDIGPGSLHDTLTHIIGAMRSWTETLAEVELRPRLEDDGQHRSPEQLRMLLDETQRELLTEAHRRPLEQIVSRQLRSGKMIQITRGAVLVHVTTHGMHHRAQCLNMLRRLGVDPLPQSSVTEWTWAGEVQR